MFQMTIEIHSDVENDPLTGQLRQIDHAVLQEKFDTEQADKKPDESHQLVRLMGLDGFIDGPLDNFRPVGADGLSSEQQNHANEKPGFIRLGRLQQPAHESPVIGFSHDLRIAHDLHRTCENGMLDGILREEGNVVVFNRRT